MPFDLDKKAGKQPKKYCKKHKLEYARYLVECPICRGETMTPAMTRKEI